jgi:hypothetical protein
MLWRNPAGEGSYLLQWSLIPKASHSRVQSASFVRQHTYYLRRHSNLTLPC